MRGNRNVFRQIETWENLSLVGLTKGNMKGHSLGRRKAIPDRRSKMGEEMMNQ